MGKFEEGGDEEVPLEVIDNLRSFRIKSRFKRICTEVVAHTLDDKQIKDLKSEFLKFDSEETGSISIKEFRNVLSNHDHISEDDVKHMFDHIDFGQTNSILYREFIAAATDMKTVTDANLRVAFDLISNHSDTIGLTELKDLVGADTKKHGTVEDIMREMNMTKTPRVPQNRVSSITY